MKTTKLGLKIASLGLALGLTACGDLIIREPGQQGQGDELEADQGEIPAKDQASASDAGEELGKEPRKPSRSNDSADVALEPWRLESKHLAWSKAVAAPEGYHLATVAEAMDVRESGELDDDLIGAPVNAVIWTANVRDAKAAMMLDLSNASVIPMAKTMPLQALYILNEEI